MIYIFDFIKSHYSDRLSLAHGALYAIIRSFPDELNYPNNGRRLTGDDILRLLNQKTDVELLKVKGIGKTKLGFLRDLQTDVRRAL